MNDAYTKTSRVYVAISFFFMTHCSSLFTCNIVQHIMYIRSHLLVVCQMSDCLKGISSNVFGYLMHRCKKI